MPLLKEEIPIAGSNGKPILLDITYKAGQGKCPVLIYAHGFNGFKDWGNFDLVAGQFVSAGFTFVKFNFSHNGTTPAYPQDFMDLPAFAENNYTKELYDLGKVLDWIADNEYNAFIDSSKIGLIGHSMGGGISIIATAEDTRISALITWASIAECKTPWGSWPAEKIKAWKKEGVQYYLNGRTGQQMPMHYQLYEDYATHSGRLDITAAATRIKVPWLICHGLADTSVPVAAAHQLHTAQPASALYLIDSDHVFGRKHPWTAPFLPEAMQKILSKNVDFFRKHFSATR